MSFVYRRYAQTLEPSSYPIVNPSYMPAGPEAAPTLVQSAASPTLTTGSPLSIGGLSTASAAYLATLLSFIGLLLAALVIWKVRRRRSKSDASDKLSTEKNDEEAQPPTRPVITVTPQASVRWQPQIRSISGPGPKETEIRVPPPPRRTRSPPPTRTYNAKNQDPFADPCPRSAPASAVSFSEDSLRSPRWQKGFREETTSPSVSPHALAVSGVQTRSLARPSQLSNNDA